MCLGGRQSHNSLQAGRTNSIRYSSASETTRTSTTTASYDQASVALLPHPARRKKDIGSPSANAHTPSQSSVEPQQEFSAKSPTRGASAEVEPASKMQKSTASGYKSTRVTDDDALVPKRVEDQCGDGNKDSKETLASVSEWSILGTRKTLRKKLHPPKDKHFAEISRKHLQPRPFTPTAETPPPLTATTPIVPPPATAGPTSTFTPAPGAMPPSIHQHLIPEEPTPPPSIPPCMVLQQAALAATPPHPITKTSKTQFSDEEAKKDVSRKQPSRIMYSTGPERSPAAVIPQHLQQQRPLPPMQPSMPSKSTASIDDIKNETKRYTRHESRIASTNETRKTSVHEGTQMSRINTAMIQEEPTPATIPAIQGKSVTFKVDYQAQS